MIVEPLAGSTGVLPDMVVMAKGLTNGVIPMGAVAVRQGLYDCFLAAAADGIELPHGYTYPGHPVAAAAALATLDIYREEALSARGRDVARSPATPSRCRRRRSSRPARSTRSRRRCATRWRSWIDRLRPR